MEAAEKIIEELLSPLKWYFEAKNLALKNALALRCPLDHEQSKELRHYYSSYFINLVSATELVREHRPVFGMVLDACFTFDSFPDGESNHSYLRELRNSILHRGRDICDQMHLDNDMPMWIAPPIVSNESGRKEYPTFGFYSLDIIAKCEQSIGPLIALYLEKEVLPECEYSVERALAVNRGHIAASVAMPEEVKQGTLNVLQNIDLEAIYRDTVNQLLTLLRSNSLERIYFAPR